MLVAGNGGAARGAVFALLDAGAKVTITGRSMDKVKSLARATGAQRGDAMSCDRVLRRGSACNAARDASQRRRMLLRRRDSSRPRFRHGLQPSEDDAFLKRAEEQGRETIPGLEMFMEQAARQFEIFTGEQAPRPAMEKAAIEALGLSS